MRNNMPYIFMLCVLLFVLAISCNNGERSNEKGSEGSAAVAPDRDTDGIPDDADKCPDLTGVAAYSGCPVPDTDGDGVNDEEDKCPTRPGSKNSGGCPESTIADTTHSTNIGDRADSVAKTMNHDHQIIVSSSRDHYSHTNSFPKPHTIIKKKDPATTSTETKNLDSLISFPKNEIQGQTIIAYSFRKILPIHEPRIFKVLVKPDKISGMDVAVRDELRSSLHENPKDAEGDTSQVESVKYIGGKYYDVRIACDSNIFLVDSQHIPARQELSDYGNTWEWKITGLKKTNSQEITFIVTVLDEKNNPVPLGRLNIPVSVTVRPLLSYKSVFIGIGCLIIVLLAVLIHKRKVAADKSIYFSYSWSDNEQTHIIDNLDKSLTAAKFRTVRDKNALKPHGKISDFMTRVGKANYIIVALSNRYLRSRFCMYELYEIFRNSKMEPIDFKRRIFPIRIDNIKLSESIGDYISFWQAETKKLLEEQSVDYNKMKTITDDLGQLLTNLDDVLGFNPDTVEQNDFAELKGILKKAMTEHGKT